MTRFFQMHKRPNGTLFLKKITKILPHVNSGGRRISAASVSFAEKAPEKNQPITNITRCVESRAHGERFNRQNETNHKIKLSKNLK